MVKMQLKLSSTSQLQLDVGLGPTFKTTMKN
jgi:hypothetical protein